MENVKEDKVYIQVENCLLEKMDDDSLLFNPKTGTTLRLNPSSAMVWHMCDGGRSVAQLIADLTESFPEQAKQIPDDVAKALQELWYRGVINVVKE